MVTLHLDTGILNNKNIILEGNSPLNEKHMEILKSFEIVYIGRDFNQSLGGLPSCIKAIRYNIYDDFFKKWGRNCGSGCNGNHGHIPYKEFAFNQHLNNLHYGLEYLELYGIYKQELNNLPSSLKYLLIFWRCNTNLQYLPEGLKMLYLDYIDLDAETLSLLPRSMQELYLNGGVRGTIYGLPNSLKILYLNGIYTKLDKFIELPANLHTFIFYDSELAKENKHTIKWLFKNKKMPKSLHKCVFPLHYVDIFSDLKTFAKEYIERDIEWKFLEISPDLLIENVRYMYR